MSKRNTPASTRSAATNAATPEPPAAETPAAETPDAGAGDAGGSPTNFRARVRMYRQGLGDCFLVTFPRKQGKPFHMLIDCGVLVGNKVKMTELAEKIRDTVRGGDKGKAELDVVVGTHEHKDHLSGFNQARAVFDNDFKFDAVWLPWTENLSEPEIASIKKARRKAVRGLREATKSMAGMAGIDGLENMCALARFSEDTVDDGDASSAPAPADGGGAAEVGVRSDDPDEADEFSASTRSIAGALGYLKNRGRAARNLHYWEPGTGPVKLNGVDGVRVWVLGPPRDPNLLKGSEVTEQMKADDVVFHLSATGAAGVDALNAALHSSLARASAAAAANSDAAANNAAGPGSGPSSVDRYHPFSGEHRIAPQVAKGGTPDAAATSKYELIEPFVNQTYDNAKQAWRRIDGDWARAFGQLALDLDSDTNNTSLVLAFEFEQTKEVLLFVGDAQVGNWQSWAKVDFKVPGQIDPMPAHDLLRRTVFYKVGHHCSHNATLDKGGLRLMTRDDLVAFVPLDRETAAKQGKHGWEMPAKALYAELTDRAKGRVFISCDKNLVKVDESTFAVNPETDFIDYILK